LSTFPGHAKSPELPHPVLAFTTGNGQFYPTLFDSGPNEYFYVAGPGSEYGRTRRLARDPDEAIFKLSSLAGYIGVAGARFIDLQRKSPGQMEFHSSVRKFLDSFGLANLTAVWMNGHRGMGTPRGR